MGRCTHLGGRAFKWEMAAAYAADVITAEEAVSIAYYRGQVAKDIDTPGSMVSVGLGADLVAPFLIPGCVIACENSPKNVTLSGDTEEVTAVCQKIKESVPGVFLRQLQVKITYHSDHMKQVGQKYEQLLDPLVKGKAPAIPFFSSVHKKVLNQVGQWNASYLLVGGLGGLGRAISTWMVENGARQLIYLSRSAGKSDDNQAFIRELESQGCSIQAFAGSVTSVSDVLSVVKSASKPIKVVLQMAMVIRNRDFTTMNYSDWTEVVQPKVQGTWNLHHILPKELDLFVATASISGTFGYYGQANYGGGNTFLDAFVTYRNSLGLPAAVLDLGAVAEIGYMKENFVDQQTYRLSGNHYIDEQALLDASQWGIRKCQREHADADGRNHIVIGLHSKKPLSDPSNRIPWKRDMRVGIYHNLDANKTTGPTKSAGKLETFVSAIATDPSILSQQGSLDFIAEEIGRQIHILMLRPVESVDVSITLEELGMDSLVMIEMRGWIKRNLGVEISTLELLSCGTIKGVSELVSERLRVKWMGVPWRC